LARYVPEVRGRDRVIQLARGQREPTGHIHGELTNGLLFDFDDARDNAMTALLMLQYVRPALAPVLEAGLATGGSFWDIGANVGLYAAWASRIVGSTGYVRAFEPAQESRMHMERFLALNGLRNVDVVPYAVGSEHGSAWLRIEKCASLQANVVRDPGPLSHRIEVVALDEYIDAERPPSLLKIDVEGYEYQALTGARGFLARHRPAIAIEALPAHLERSGATFPDVLSLLGELGYQTLDLTPRGLRPCGEVPTTNVLALCLDLDAHRQLKGCLAKVRFARNQSL
jgi:FkbM family methyltransferase